jgi:hypothetical protein
MTETPTPDDAICAAVDRHHGDHSDGALLAVFLDRRGTVVLTVGFDEGTSDVDELFLRHLVAIVGDIRVAEVVFAVVRASGRPTRIDKLLWRELTVRLAGATTSLRDVIVVGERQRWSAASGRTASVARAA